MIMPSDCVSTLQRAIEKYARVMVDRLKQYGVFDSCWRQAGV